MKGVKFLSCLARSFGCFQLVSVQNLSPRLLFLWCSVFWSADVLSGSACQTIDCDCLTLTIVEQRDSCSQRQVMLVQACQSSGAVQGFCQQAGLRAFPVALSLPAQARQALIATALTIDELRAQSRVLHWSVNEDHSASKALQNNDNFRGALALRKRENVSRKKLQALQYRLAELLMVSDGAADAKQLFQSLYPLHETAAIDSYRSGAELWQLPVEAELADKKRKLQLILAQRLLRNAGDSMELAADAAFQAGDYEEALQAWRLAARYTRELVGWKQAAGAKDSHVRFYEARAAARLQRASLLAAMEPSAYLNE